VNRVPLAWRALALALCAGVGACERDGGSNVSPSSNPSNSTPVVRADAAQPDGTVRMQIGRETFTLEVAATGRARQIGLMHRRSMPQDRGMIFSFPQAQSLGFWMKNTHIPLDIVYLDENGKVVSVKQMKPMDETRVESDAPAKYAVELNQGAAQRAGVKVGDVLNVPAAARDATW
jgi:uncharacterized membrane protein (UPF0127 family)